MAKQRRISVSFSKEYYSEYEFLTGLSNSSDFICRAVREKLQNERQKPHDLENYIRGVVERVLIEKGPLSNSLEHPSTQEPAFEQDLINAADSFEL